MKILVTGATGKLGSLVVETLLESVPDKDLAVSVRNPEKAESLRGRGADVRLGDFEQPDTLDKAFAGIDRGGIRQSRLGDPSRLYTGSCSRTGGRWATKLMPA
ncbi:hypothetical protein FPZ49_04810 [Paenibacillus cremeus]|uniref:NAD(P)-binding domain-containing protein n=1 Tax=Paenibacillus cremeus TaxID=2163881 RepID=A0A559KGC9_9BACL|nr:hypothetical protein FPZ49_04810 [Paenibacillus cremeus]